MCEEVEILKGKTLTEIKRFEPEDYKSEVEDELHFHTSDGEIYRMYHRRDCCESVFIEEVIGDLDDLIGSPLTLAEEVSNREDEPLDAEWDDSYTWTFYKFATIKGYVTIRWYGTSNGYYSESVDFELMDHGED